VKVRVSANTRYNAIGVRNAVVLAYVNINGYVLCVRNAAVQGFVNISGSVVSVRNAADQLFVNMTDIVAGVKNAEGQIYANINGNVVNVVLVLQIPSISVKNATLRRQVGNTKDTVSHVTCTSSLRMRCRRRLD
jgi:hypothetical protein